VNLDVSPRAPRRRSKTSVTHWQRRSARDRTNLASGTAPALLRLRLLKAYKPSAEQSATVGVVSLPQRRQKQLDQHAQTGPKVLRRVSLGE
jgi:hypothetical protein